MLKSFIKFSDLFPERFEFKLTSKGWRKTVSGGIISIILIISSLFLSILMFYNFASNRKPNLIFQNMYDNSAQLKNISIENLQLAISLWKDGQSFQQRPIKIIKSEIFENVIFKNKTKELKRNSKNIGKFIYCDQNSTNHDFANQFINDVNMSSSICMNLTQDFKIGGNLLDIKSYLTINIEIDLCSAFNNGCEGISEGNLYFALHYLDKYFNVDDPVGYNNFSNYFDFQVNNGDLAYIKLNMINNNITTNDHFLTDNQRKNNFYNIESYSITRSTYPKLLDQNRTQIVIRVEMPMKYNYITRSYPKLDSYLALLFHIGNA